MSDWRHDPATDAQKKRLKEEGFKHSSSITKGEASDLIGSTTSPGEREKAILKFFKAQGISKMSETDARKKIESILSDPANTQRWENRPADKEQKDVYHFFNLKVPPKLSRPDAARFIDELLKDEEKAKAWDKHEEEAADREAWFEDNFEMFNDIREDYDCKKITFKLFQQVVESLQASGMTLEQIEENEDAFFEKALEINPNLQRAPSGRSSSTTEYRDNGKSGISLRGIVILAIIILVVWAIIWGSRKLTPTLSITDGQVVFPLTLPHTFQQVQETLMETLLPCDLATNARKDGNDGSRRLIAYESYSYPCEKRSFAAGSDKSYNENTN